MEFPESIDSRLNWTPGTADQLIREGKLTTRRLPWNGKLVVYPADLESFLALNKQKTDEIIEQVKTLNRRAVDPEDPDAVSLLHANVRDLDQQAAQIVALEPKKKRR